MTCAIPPEGWRCTRAPGHDGPCAAVPNYMSPSATLWREVDALGGAVESERDAGYADALAKVLAILERRGFTEHDNRPTSVGEQQWPDIGSDPMKGDRSNRYEASAAACREAYVKQQPFVPDQTALVWRWHLGALVEEHLRLNAILARKDDAAALAMPVGGDREAIERVLVSYRNRSITLQDAIIALRPISATEGEA